MVAAKLLHLFPEARVIHVYRDGRDTAMSMAHHHNFRVLVGAMKASRRFGIDGFRPLHQPRGRMLDVWLQRLIFPRLNVRRLAGDVTLADLGEFWSRMILLGQQVFADLPPDRLLSLKFEDVQQSPRDPAPDDPLHRPVAGGCRLAGRGRPHPQTRPLQVHHPPPTPAPP
ncbi:hypothetical protein ACFQ4K_13325 [Tistrella bauzanensis]